MNLMAYSWLPDTSRQGYGQADMESIQYIFQNQSYASYSYQRHSDKDFGASQQNFRARSLFLGEPDSKQNIYYETSKQGDEDEKN